MAEARGDVSPFGEKGLIGRAATDVAADSHRSESAAVIALTARDDAIASRLTVFQVKLTGQLDGGFRGFGAARSEIDSATGTKIWRG